MKATIVIVTAVVFTFLTISSTQAAVTITTSSPGDGYWHNEVGSSYDYWDGTSTGLSAYYLFYGTSDTLQYNTGFAQFSLASLPSGTTVQSATLNLYLTERHYSGSTTSAGTVNHVANSSGATGSASQKLGGNEQVGEIIDQPVGWLSLDITSYLQNDLDNGYAYSSFSFDPNTTGTYDNRNAGFTISTSDAPTNQPYLSVTVVPEPTTTAFIVGASVLLIFFKRRA